MLGLRRRASCDNAAAVEFGQRTCFAGMPERATRASSRKIVWLRWSRARVCVVSMQKLLCRVVHMCHWCHCRFAHRSSIRSIRFVCPNPTQFACERLEMKAAAPCRGLPAMRSSLMLIYLRIVFTLRFVFMPQLTGSVLFRNQRCFANEVHVSANADKCVLFAHSPST